MQTRIVAGLGLGLIAAVGLCGPALAIEVTPTPAPTSSALPSWYDTAPGPSYDASAKPDGHAGATLTVGSGNQPGSEGTSSLRIDYWGSDGAGPTSGQDDVTVRIASQGWDKITVPINGTDFRQTVTGFVDIAMLPDSGAGDQPTVSIQPDGQMSFTRPPVPANCVPTADPTVYTFRTAALGEDGRKYAVGFNVTFWERPQSVYDACIAALHPLPSHTGSGTGTGATNAGTPQQTHADPYALSNPNPSLSWGAPAAATPLTDFVRGTVLLFGLATLGFLAVRIWTRRAQNTNGAAATESPSAWPAHGGTSAASLPMFNNRGQHIAGPTFAEYFGI